MAAKAFRRPAALEVYEKEVIDPQGRIHLLGDEPVQALAASRLDDPAQDHEVQIAVEHPFPRPVREGLPAEQFPQRRGTFQKRTGCQLRMIWPVVRQAGGVGEQLGDGHAGLVAARKLRQHGREARLHID